MRDYSKEAYQKSQRWPNNRVHSLYLKRLFAWALVDEQYSENAFRWEEARSFQSCLLKHRRDVTTSMDDQAATQKTDPRMKQPLLFIVTFLALQACK